MKIQPSYWKQYDQVFKNYSYKTIHQEILSLAKTLGNPFPMNKMGRKPKATPTEYAAFVVFEIITDNSPLRDMELDSELFLNRHIDHSTFGRKYWRIPYEYLVNILKLVAKKLDSLLGTCFAKICDSTGISTNIFEETMIKGRITTRNKDFKLHGLVAYYPDKKILYFKNALGSDKHISDAEGAKKMIQEINESGYYFADRAFDAEKVYKEILEVEGIPIIKPKKYKAKMSSCKAKGREYWHERLYKEIRGMIEPVFGGLENKGLLKTNYRKEESVNKFSVVVAFGHNLRTLMRVKVNSIKFLFILRQTRKYSICLANHFYLNTTIIID